ncbi:DUF2254 family protein [Rathayibacter oskolensis]|nr:DUF2254 family protein [Rathayibacter oskolensis]WKK72524.1 DUF2254 family protein [Rathayibacter oskolensis]
MPAGDAVLAAARGGYVERIEIERLVALAEQHDAVVRVLAVPGDHVLEGDPVLEIGRSSAETRRRRSRRS